MRIERLRNLFDRLVKSNSDSISYYRQAQHASYQIPYKYQLSVRCASALKLQDSNLGGKSCLRRMVDVAWRRIARMWMTNSAQTMKHTISHWVSGMRKFQPSSIETQPDYQSQTRPRGGFPQSSSAVIGKQVAMEALSGTSI